MFKNYIKKFFIQKQLKKDIIVLHNLEKEYKNYSKILLDIISLKLELIYKYNDSNYWRDMFIDIDKYMINYNYDNKPNLIDTLQNAKIQYVKYRTDIQKILEHIDTRIEKYTKQAKIFNCDVASIYKPNNTKTIMIRLLDSQHLEAEKESYFIPFPNIKYEDKFYKIIEIYIDDVDSIQYKEEYLKKMNEDINIIPFSVEIAQKLLNEINKITDSNLNKYDLVTHCRLGKSRSTAIFISLNEIYNLGYKNLKDLHIHYNRQIYTQMIEVYTYP